MSIQNKENIKENIKKYIAAMSSSNPKDHSVLVNDFDIDATYDSSCGMRECHQVSIVSAWSKMKNARMTVAALWYLIANGTLDVHRQCELLAALFGISGCNDTSERCTELINELLRSLRDHKETVKAWRSGGDVISTMLHKALSGYDQQWITDWAMELYRWGINPFTKVEYSEGFDEDYSFYQTPFSMAVNSINAGLVYEWVDKTSMETGVDTINEFRWSKKAGRGRDLGMSILWNHKYAHGELARNVLDIVNTLRVHGLNDDNLDVDMYNIGDYVYSCGWVTLWEEMNKNGAHFGPIPSSTGKYMVKKTDSYYKQKNPSLFAHFMQLYKSTKTLGPGHEDEWGDLLALHGPLTRAQIRDSGKHNDEFECLEQLVWKLGYHDTSMHTTTRNAANVME